MIKDAKWRGVKLYRDHVLIAEIGPSMMVNLFRPRKKGARWVNRPVRNFLAEACCLFKARAIVEQETKKLDGLEKWRRLS